jgi:hypothetical protein
MYEVCDKSGLAFRHFGPYETYKEREVERKLILRYFLFFHIGTGSASFIDADSLSQ